MNSISTSLQLLNTQIAQLLIHMRYTRVGTSIAPCFHYMPAEHKESSKKFVARFPADSKTPRQALKQLFVAILNQFPWINTNAIAVLKTRYEPERGKEIYRFQVKNSQGQVDYYELVKMVALAKNLPSRSILVKNDALCHELAEEVKDSITSTLLSSIFKGDRLEIVSLEPYHPEVLEYWDEWMEDSPVGEDYEKIWHPAMACAALHLLQHVDMPVPRILDICGGYGLLANQIFTHCLKNLDYTLVDYNEVALNKARELLKDKARLIKADIVDEFLPEEQSIDLIIGCGALTTGVLSNRVEALNVLENLLHGLKPGGFLLLAGHGDSFLSREDFTGCVVLNTSLPGHRKEFYIVQKQ